MKRSRRSSTAKGVLLGLLVAAPPIVLADENLPPSSAWTVTVAAQADSRAEIDPCHCPGQEAGGLSRRAAILKQIQTLPHPTVVADGGDFAPTPDDSLREAKSRLVVEAMELMRYDAVGLGELELLSGVDFLERAAKRLPLVGSNLVLSESLDIAIPATRWIEEGGKHCLVLSYIEPLLFYENPRAFDLPVGLRDPAEALGPLVAAHRDSADLIVLLAHASAEGIEETLRGIEGVDVVVLGHEPEDAREIHRFGLAYGIVPGPFSRQIGVLTLTMDRPEGTGVHYKVWDLKSAMVGDARVEELLERFRREHGASR